ncbi:MAG: DinB family protein [Chloroflexota bacterium]
MIHPQALIKTFGYNAELVNKQLKGMTHSESLFKLPFEANCLNWVLGHIISSRTMALQKVGQEPVWSTEERTSYRFGSSNWGDDGPNVFRLEKLLLDFNLSQERLLAGLNNMTYEDMCQPSGYGSNTQGDSLGYFQFHEAQHVGQIIYLAKMAGKEEVWISS